MYVSNDETDEGTVRQARSAGRLGHRSPVIPPFLESVGRPFRRWSIWAPFFLIVAVGCQAASVPVAFSTSGAGAANQPPIGSPYPVASTSSSPAPTRAPRAASMTGALASWPSASGTEALRIVRLPLVEQSVGNEQPIPTQCGPATIQPATFDAPVKQADGLKRPTQTPAGQEIGEPEIPGTSEVKRRLTIPAGIPGALAPPLILPPVDEDHPQKRLTAIDILFPNPPPVSEIATPAETQVVTLEQLEEMAVNNNPTLVQARGNVTFNRGAAIQAGVYPNPSVGYETDSFGSGYSRNYEGVSLQQTVKTAGKLTLQRTIANMDMMNAELQWRRTELDVRRQVRAGYYNVLVAQEANKINTALLRFTNDVYLVQVQRLKNGEEAGYQPAQLRTLVVQARAALVQSQNRYISAWKQMAAAIGVPTLPPATLADRVDMPLPDLNFDALLEKVLNVYPDAQAARNLEAQARFNLRLQQVTPIPDVTVYAGFFRDTTDPAAIRSGTYNMTVSVPIPIFDKNIGNIVSAEGRLVIAQEQLRVVRNQLTGQLADAFERFQTNRVQAQFYREQILPDLARSYRGVYERNLQEPDIVAFGDIIVAQQNLSSGVSTYIGILLQQWVAVTDIANLLQLQTLGDFYRLAPADSTPAAEQIPLPPPTR